MAVAVLAKVEREEVNAEDLDEPLDVTEQPRGRGGRAAGSRSSARRVNSVNSACAAEIDVGRRFNVSGPKTA